MFTVQTYRKREFSGRHQYIAVAAPQYQIKTIAFLGCVCQDRGIYYYELHDKSINTEKFLPFLRNLRAKFGPGRLALYQDNLRVHTTNLAKQLYEELDIEVQFAPIYSPTLNAIELTFSLLKNSVKRMRLNDMTN